MINSKVVIKNEWKDVQELAGKLVKIIDARTKMQELTDIEYKEETRFIFDGYRVLSATFAASEGNQRKHIDEYFTELFNEVIIKYVTDGKQQENGNSEDDDEYI